MSARDDYDDPPRPRRIRTDDIDRDRDRDQDYGDARKSRPRPKFEDPPAPRDISPGIVEVLPHDLEGKTTRTNKDFRSKRNDYENEEADLLKIPKPDKARRSPKGGYSDGDDDDAAPPRRKPADDDR